eukprot:CAMPEP_0179037626 /NCGR_PEP_ID=MMETSP0796-20121207/14224_1 /TAXON_ID=73915 /ORGANISM="Pyrodinium bahamense, Strain pbaha01" /LENGTH=60 /DNA_ID=CAMNT_0020733937 /DNA_START=108 /DNA_END=287 /DNA_ORIENTATION=-
MSQFPFTECCTPGLHWRCSAALRAIACGHAERICMSTVAMSAPCLPLVEQPSSCEVLYLS